MSSISLLWQVNFLKRKDPRSQKEKRGQEGMPKVYGIEQVDPLKLTA